MKKFLLAAALTLSAQAETIVTLGDSLTFAYEAEFCFQLDLSTLGYGLVGDGFNPDEVKNWAELLHEYRNTTFDLGPRDDINLVIPLSSFPFVSFETLHLRRENNWAVPGFKIDQLRRFLTRESTVLTLMSENPSFALLEQALQASDFNEATDFAIEDLENLIQNDADRLVLFIGGNDAPTTIYEAAYLGFPTDDFTNEFIADADAILDIIQTLNPSLPIVLVNVPHIGITPIVKDTVGTDPSSTANVTTFMRRLNDRLRELASSRGIAYADVFTPTLPLLSNNPLGVYGIPFENSGSTTGNLDYVWLNGQISTNFHPNTSAQALIANEIICAFNDYYDSSIPPLTTTEVLGDILGKSPAQIDMDFATWASGYSLPGLALTDDSDNDTLPAHLEFALGLNPLLSDCKKVSLSQTRSDNTPHLEIKYPVRLPTSTHVTVLPESTSHLALPFTPFAQPPTPGTDGYARARLPINADSGFLRLRAVPNP